MCRRTLSRRFPRRSDATSTQSSSVAVTSIAGMTTTAAGEAGDNNVEEADDGANDGLQNCADAAHDGHQTVPDCLKDSFNLGGRQRVACE
jgi:hypothetical protein